MDYLGRLFENYRSEATCFHCKICLIILTKNGLVSHFGRHFSQTHLKWPFSLPERTDGGLSWGPPSSTCARSSCRWRVWCTGIDLMNPFRPEFTNKASAASNMYKRVNLDFRLNLDICTKLSLLYFKIFFVKEIWKKKFVQKTSAEMRIHQIGTWRSHGLKVHSSHKTSAKSRSLAGRTWCANTKCFVCRQPFSEPGILHEACGVSRNVLEKNKIRRYRN
jgi:hypothetical protein